MLEIRNKAQQVLEKARNQADSKCNHATRKLHKAQQVLEKAQNQADSKCNNADFTANSLLDNPDSPQP